MVAPRQKNHITSRRRIDDEGEEEDGSVAAGVDDDSLSEGSIISDADDDADAEGSDASDRESIERRNVKTKILANGHVGSTRDSPKKTTVTSEKASFSTAMNDTEAMMNGLKFSGDVDEGEEMDFEDMGKQIHEPPAAAPGQEKVESASLDTVGDKRRREHEEYRKQRDADPAFVPNRGGFFMHDHRSSAPGQNGFRPFGRGRGRGRAGPGGPFPPVGYVSTEPICQSHALLTKYARSHMPQPSGPADAPWAHDLHETVVQEGHDNVTPQSVYQGSQERPKMPSLPLKAQPPNRSFSRTTRIGLMQIRVYMLGMADPITFSAVPVNQHTRLPHHRPPLRRDKPVRISLPNMPIRYIFPSTDRSFIFIPRALRPHQQGFGKARGRGSFNGGYGSFGGFSSRRTSAYAGSAYSPSVAMSRRSSLAREVALDGVVPSISAETGKPVVRLPPAVEQVQVANQPAAGAVELPTVKLPQSANYPLPQKPTFRENRPAPIPMHQPIPQKTVSVADIESPATLDVNPPQQQQQQPFHQQVPTQVPGPGFAQDMAYYPHSRHPSHPSQGSGTPLSQIPERAIHAQPFQPIPYQQPQTFYPQQFPPPMYYYPPADQVPVMAPSVGAPPFVPGQQYPYPIPVAAPPPPPPPPAEPTSQAGTVAHESNGMVYYYDSSQLTAGPEFNTPYPPAAYAMPQSGGVVGMGGTMTPPVQYYTQPSPAVYYPQQ